MTNEPESAVITFKEFLENTPPGKSTIVSNFKILLSSRLEDLKRALSTRTLQDGYYLGTSALKLYCANDECMGNRTFEAFYTLDRQVLSTSAGISNHYLTYKCQNCKSSLKTFAIRLILAEAEAVADNVEVFKYGEIPQFGSPTPRRALNLIDPDKELFLTGRRAENQGMGIGAFAYYRRVVENQKDRIFDEIIKALKKISPDSQAIEQLENAKNQISFTRAVEEIKQALPPSLQINGYNPLTLLYSALSEGVHDHSDEKCLALASDIRTILIEFADRLTQVLKEDAELNDAVSRLAKVKATKQGKG